MHWKTMLTWAAAAVVTMYAIRYLRASNAMVAQLYPAGPTATAQAVQ